MPGLDTHVKRSVIALQALLILFAFIEMVQTAVLVASYNRNDDYPSASVRDRVRFLLFCAIWTLVITPVYLVGFLKAAGSFVFSIASHAAWFALTWVFWLAGAAAFTSALGGGLDCGALPDDFGHCNQLNAAEAFAWINWILITFALSLVIFIGARSARGGNGFASPMYEP